MPGASATATAAAWANRLEDPITKVEGVARVQRAVRDAGGQRSTGCPCRQIALAMYLCMGLWMKLWTHVVGRDCWTSVCGGYRGAGTSRTRHRPRASGSTRSAGETRVRGRRLVGHRAFEARIHAHGEAHRFAKALAEGVLDACAQSSLELVAGELVRNRHHGRALGEHQRLARGQPHPLVGRQAVHDARPEDLALPFDGCAVVRSPRFAVLHTFVHRLCDVEGGPVGDSGDVMADRLLPYYRFVPRARGRMPSPATGRDRGIDLLVAKRCAPVVGRASWNVRR